MRHKNLDPPETVTLNIPRSVILKTRVILADPSSGKIRYGAMAKLITNLLEQWLSKNATKLEKSGSGGAIPS